MNKRIWTQARRPGLMVAALVLGHTGSAGAQEFEASGRTFGAPERRIEVDLTGLATYDTNVSRTSDAAAAARGIEQEDVRLTPAVQATVVLPTPAAVLTLTGSLGHDFYLRNNQLNRERIDLLGGAGTKFASCDLGAQIGYRRAQNDLGDLSIVPGDPTASTVNVQDTLRLGGTIACGTTIRPTAFVDYRTTDNSNARRRISDVDTLTYGGGVSYSNERFGVLTVFVGRSEFAFPERAGLAGALQSFDSTLLGVRLDRRLGARLQVHGQLTYVDVSAAGSAGDTFDGLNWDVSAALRIGDRAQLSLAALRQIDASAAFNLRTAQLSAYVMKLDYAFSVLLRGTITASIREREFENDPALAPIVLLSDDRTSEIGGRLAYTLGRRITLTASASYQERQADVALYEYDAFRATLGIALRL